MSVINLGKKKEVGTTVENQSPDNVDMIKFLNEYRDCINFLRIRGVNVDKQMADKIKNDMLIHKSIIG